MHQEFTDDLRIIQCIAWEFITPDLSLRTQVYFQLSLLSTQKVIIPVLPKKLKYTVYLKPSRLRVVPHFSSGIVEPAKCEHAWKSPHARKGNTRRGERKMRDYRQSPSFWPFTADWFWSVKFVSPSKSIKHIQWDSFPYWAVIALVIGKLQGIFIASKRKPRY